MTVVISDLVARVRAEGVQETAQTVKAVGDAAQQAARALEIMAEASAKQSGGSPQGWMDIFKQGNVQPTAAALAQAAQEMQRTAQGGERLAASLRTATQAAQDLVRINVSQPMATMMDARGRAMADAMVQEERRTREEERRARDFQQRQADFLRQQRFGMVSGPPERPANAADGDAGSPFGVSDASLARFGATLVGVNVGFSLAVAAARTIRDAIVGTVQAQADWERSLVQVRAMYGEIAPQVVALSQAQAALPGVVSSQADLLQANMQARFLTTRYGVSPALAGTLTTQAARLGGLLFPGGDQAAQRQAVQDALLQYAQSGNGQQLQQLTGQPLDPLILARRLGFGSEAALQGLTPQQVVEAQTRLGIATAARANIQGQGQAAGLLERQRDLQHALEQAQANLQTGLEGLQQQPPAVAGQSELARATNFPLLGPAGERQQTQDLQRYAQAQAQYEQAVKDAQAALDANSAALADNQKQLEEASAALAKMGVEAGSAAARLLAFTGSLEDPYSIARGDIGAQAQAAVTARARSAIPAIGIPQREIEFQANQTAYAQAYQNFTATVAQRTQDNAIRETLTQLANQQGPGLDAQRTAAQQALVQAQRAGPVQTRIGEAQRTAAVVDMQTAETQASLERIQITQRERYVQLLRDTVDLRRLDLQQQMQGVEAQQMLIRAQQGALPSQFAVSNAQYQVNRAQVLAQARMARLLRGEDVSNMPSIEQLIQMNVQGQLDVAEAGPAALEGQRAIELAQRTVTSRGLAQQLTQNQIQTGELGVDLANLGDLPTQTALELELVQNNRDQLAVQKELRDATKQLVAIMGSQLGSSSSIDLGNLIFGEGGDIPAPQTLPGARRGPF